MKTIDRRLYLLGAALIMTAVAVRPASAQTKVSGVVYSQYGYATSADTAGVHQNAFDVTRAYLNFTHSFDHGIATRITGDIYRDANGSINYRLKYAYFTWTPKNSHVDFRFGQTQTPWLDWDEGLWGYRMQGPMALDRNHYITSSDIGLAMDGSWAEHKFDIQLSAMNGEGYHAGEGDQHKDISARASLRLLKSDEGGSRGGLRVTVYGQTGHHVGGAARDRLIGMLSYKSKVLLLAGEAASMKDGSTKGRMVTLFGTLTPKDSKVGIIGRVDILDPNTSVSNDGNTRVIAGVSYDLSPNVKLLADVDHVSYQGTPSVETKAKGSHLYFQTQFTF